MFVVKMDNPKTDRQKLRTSHASRRGTSYYDATMLRLSSLLIKWTLSIVRMIVRALYALDAKIHRRPASLDLLVLRNMLDVAENLPRFRTMRELQYEAQRHSLSQIIIKGMQSGLVWLISVPVERALRLVSRVLRSLYGLDKKLHQRSPRTLPILKGALSGTETTLRFVEELKSVNQSRLMRAQI